MCTPIIHKAPKFKKEPDWEKWSLFLLVLIILILFFSGCSRKVYVPVETVRTETSIRERFLRDSIYVHDSTYVREKGDTVLVERWHTRWRDRMLTDTCYIHRRDSVAVPYPVEKKLSKWQNFKLDYGGNAIVAVIIIILIGVGYLVYKLRK